MDIPEQLRQIAHRQKVSDYRLAKDAGVVVSVIQQWQNGGGLRCDTAERIAAALGYKIALQPAKGGK